MAYATHEQSVVPGAFARFFNAIASGFNRISVHSTVIRQLNEISQLSDADLEQRGLTREEAVRSVLAGRIGL
ncbi:MAG: hypothetical protein AB3N11_15095 [Arenibacterium sp.]